MWESLQSLQKLDTNNGCDECWKWIRADGTPVLFILRWSLIVSFQIHQKLSISNSIAQINISSLAKIHESQSRRISVELGANEK